MILIGLAMIAGQRGCASRLHYSVGGVAGADALVLLGLARRMWDFERLSSYPLTLWLTWTGFLMFHG